VTAALADPSPLVLDALVGRWTATQGPMVEKATARALARWGALDVYSGDEVFRFGRDMAALSTAVQGVSRNLMLGYLRSTLQVLNSPLGRGVLVASVAALAIRKGVELARVYERPAKTVRYLVSEGVAPEMARIRAAQRLVTLIDTDAQLAARQAAHDLFDVTDDEVRGYRRVLRPELSKGTPCALCVVASDQIYRKAELLPIHDGCHCLPLPIVGDRDPGADLNLDDLAAIYDQAGGTGRDAIKKVQIVVREHGEVGPILVDKSQHWKSARVVDLDATQAQAA
jgi:hypothetical protein